MCGITGLFGRVDQKSVEVVVNNMTNALYHRGPDDSGVWGDADSGIALGHRRLSIIDLSKEGHQPMHSKCGRYVMVFNGEIYNHKELRILLTDKGIENNWHGHSDTETLLAGFSLWGIKNTLHKIVGMFSIAVWDKKYKKLYLMRDRFGEKPLYYGWIGGGFAFGSELKSLRCCPGFTDTVDRDVLAMYLRYCYVPAPYSIYENIYKLEAGYLLSINVDGTIDRNLSPVQMKCNTDSFSIESWWSLKDIIEEKSRILISDEVDAIDCLEGKISDSIKLQSIADVPLGALLSGGIDSSCIVALMKQHVSSVKTFTIGFNEGAHNEAVYAKRIAEHLETEHTEMYVSSSDALSVIPTLPSLYDEPFADSSQIPTHLVCKLAKSQVKVVLSGDAGDELFGGYNRYLWANNIWSKVSWLPKPMRLLFSNILLSISPNNWDYLFSLITNMLNSDSNTKLFGDKVHKMAARLGVVNDLDDLYLSLVSEWDDPSSVVIGAGNSYGTLTDKMKNTSIDGIEHRMMYWDSVSYLPDDILCKVDRASMGIGLETRVPFLDHRIAEFAWSLPLDMKIRNGQSKWILRQVLYKHIPRDLIEREKAGFSVPISEWLRGPLKKWAEDLLDRSRLESEGYFSPDIVHARWNDHISGTRNWAYSLWGILMFQSWLENNT